MAKVKRVSCLTCKVYEDKEVETSNFYSSTFLCRQCGSVATVGLVEKENKDDSNTGKG